MAYTEQLPRTGILAELIRRLVKAARPHGRFAARGSLRETGRHPGGPPDAAILNDIGARRVYQDYTSSATVSAGSEQRLHRIAESSRWALPR